MTALKYKQWIEESTIDFIESVNLLDSSINLLKRSLVSAINTPSLKYFEAVQ